MNSTIRLPTLLLLITTTLTAPACGPMEDESAPAEDAPTNGSSTQAPAPPDTTATGLWAHLEEANYRAEWSHWPDREPGYAGIDPHGAHLSTWLNPVAADALSRMRNDPESSEMPAGAIVVKENRGSGGDSLHSVTAMYKHAGYDALHNDWFWLKRLADGTVEVEGRARPCADCHAEAGPDWDYLRTAADQFGG